MLMEGALSPGNCQESEGSEEKRIVFVSRDDPQAVPDRLPDEGVLNPN